MTSKGMQLLNSQDGIWTPSYTLAMRSGAPPNAGAAYALYTVGDFGNAPLLRICNQNTPQFEFMAGAAPELRIAGPGQAGRIATLTAEPPAAMGQLGVLRIAGYDTANQQGQGIDVLPYNSQRGKLGTQNVPWAGAHARYFAGQRQVLPFAPVITLDAQAADYYDITLNADLQQILISNFGPDQRLTIRFRQDQVGTRRIVRNAWPAATRMNGPLHLSLTPASSDLITFISDGINFYEMGRYQEEDPRQLVRRTVLTNTNVILDGGSFRKQLFRGVLTGPVLIILNSTDSQMGDEYLFIFEEGIGVKTTFVNSLRIQEGAVAPFLDLAIFNEDKTLEGHIHALYDGSHWLISQLATQYL
jgi:hypothetical protein